MECQKQNNLSYCIHGIIQVMSSSTANLDALEANADNNKRPKKRRRKLATVDERIKRDLGSMMYGFGKFDLFFDPLS
mgnify:CR=1 FL=1